MKIENIETDLNKIKDETLTVYQDKAQIKN